MQMEFHSINTIIQYNLILDFFFQLKMCIFWTKLFTFCTILSQLVFIFDWFALKNSSIVYFIFEMLQFDGLNIKKCFEKWINLIMYSDKQIDIVQNSQVGVDWPSL